VKEKVIWNVEGNKNDVWNRIVTCVKNNVKAIVGKSRPENKETWW